MAKAGGARGATRRIWRMLAALSPGPVPLTLIARYGASVAGVAAVTWLIGLVLPRYHIANISMVYLLLVVALAVYAGSGPAILASVLAFLAFDWFFVPPVGRFTVSDPNEWLALCLFLVVAVITGQLAARLQRRAEDAWRRERETATLYELSTAILGDVHLEHVLAIIAERLAQTLALRHAAALLMDASGSWVVAAEAGETLGTAEREDRAAGVAWAYDTGAAGQYAVPGAARALRPLSGAGSQNRDERERLLAAFLPLTLGAERLGALAVFTRESDPALTVERIRLMQAFAAQAALAIGRTRLAAEEQRARAAAESDRLKSTFLASVSHDLRTPLTAIKTAASSLLQDARQRRDAPHADLAASIDREVDHLNRLVGNLLEMSRIDAGGLPLQRAEEDVAELIGAAIDRVWPLLGGRRIRTTVPTDLPLVPLDAAQIDRVLTNLLENAVKYSPPGAAIAIDAGADGAWMCVTVHNDGPSLPEQQRTRIFDKFYRLARTADGAPGTGLGLAISKGIIEAHGGRIWAENDASGVSVSFMLPLTAATAAPPAHTGAAR